MKKVMTWCAVALALGAGVLWFCLREGGAEEKSGAAPKVEPAKSRKAKKQVAGRVGVQPSRTSSRPNQRGADAGGQRSRATEGARDVGATDAGAPEAETNAVSEAKEKPLFRHGAEQLLAMATPSEAGGYVPPLPEITDESVAEDLAKAMKDVIGPSSNDTIRTLEIKKNVAEQKEEFRELRAEGMTFVQYVNALRDKFNDDAAFLAETRKLDETLFNDAQVSDKEYKAYRAELNKQLKERGLPELEAR